MSMCDDFLTEWDQSGPWPVGAVDANMLIREIKKLRRMSSRAEKLADPHE